MLYCKKCGKENQDNSSFCVNCGAPFDLRDQVRPTQANPNQAPVNNYYNSRREIRESELREIDNLIYYFSQKAPEYEESAMLSDKLDVLERKLNRTPVAGIVLSSICGVFILLSVMLAVNHNSVYGFTAFLAFLTGIPAVIIMSVYLISMLINKPRYKKYRERFDVLNEELTRHYNDYGYCPVGIEYTNPNDLKAIRDTIQSGYADTSKEAVNYLMQKYHNEVMESNLAAAKRAANATAAISAAHFFFK